MNRIFEVTEGSLAMERLTTTFSSEIGAGINKNNNKVVGPKRSLKKGMTPLPPDFEASNYSVLCGRGKGCYNSIGNRRLRVIVSTFLQQYVAAQNSPHDKTRIIEKVVNIVKEACPVGAFIKYENGRYYELSNKGSKEKVAALFRDCLQATYKEKQAKSNKQAKQLQKRQSQSKQPMMAHEPQSLHQFQLRHFQQRLQQQNQQQQQQEDLMPPQSQQTPEPVFPIFSHLQDQPIPEITILQREDSIGSQASESTAGSFYDVDTNRSVPITAFEDDDDDDDDELAYISIDSLMG